MRHLYDRPHLNRTPSHRKALFSNLAASLILNKKVVTTLGKARYARRFAERMITFARKGDLSSRRHVLRHLHHQEAVKKLFDELGAHFKNRNGGYTRIIKLGRRRGDAAPLALIELVGFDDVPGTATPKKPTKSRLKAASKEESSKPRKVKPSATKSKSEAVEPSGKAG
jgi:large subunit ribosomal protein L17